MGPKFDAVRCSVRLRQFAFCSRDPSLNRASGQDVRGFRNRREGLLILVSFWAAWWVCRFEDVPGGVEVADGEVPCGGLQGAPAGFEVMVGSEALLAPLRPPCFGQRPDGVTAIQIRHGRPDEDAPDGLDVAEESGFVAVEPSWGVRATKDLRVNVLGVDHGIRAGMVIAHRSEDCGHRCIVHPALHGQVKRVRRIAGMHIREKHDLLTAVGDPPNVVERSRPPLHAGGGRQQVVEMGGRDSIEQLHGDLAVRHPASVRDGSRPRRRPNRRPHIESEFDGPPSRSTNNNGRSTRQQAPHDEEAPWRAHHGRWH